MDKNRPNFFAQIHGQKTRNPVLYSSRKEILFTVRPHHEREKLVKQVGAWPDMICSHPG